MTQDEFDAAARISKAYPAEVVRYAIRLVSDMRKKVDAHVEIHGDSLGAVDFGYRVERDPDLVASALAEIIEATAIEGTEFSVHQAGDIVRVIARQEGYRHPELPDPTTGNPET